MMALPARCLAPISGAWLPSATQLQSALAQLAAHSQAAQQACVNQTSARTGDNALQHSMHPRASWLSLHHTAPASHKPLPTPGPAAEEHRRSLHPLAAPSQQHAHLSDCSCHTLRARAVSTSVAASGKVKLKAAAATPPGWRWGGDQALNIAQYNHVRKEYRLHVGELRKRWGGYVQQHEALVRACSSLAARRRALFRTRCLQ